MKKNIEVEKKFILTKEEIVSLRQSATFVKREVFIDTYYDTENFSLTTKNLWLRKRKNAYELKIPCSSKSQESIDVFYEITNEKDIRNQLKCPLEEYLPFCVCTTIRDKYKKGSFTIDINQVDFEDFFYFLVEVELMVEKEEDVIEAEKNILDFAKENRWNLTPVKGKVLEYLKRKKPEHYQALIKAGIV